MHISFQERESLAIAVPRTFRWLTDLRRVSRGHKVFNPTHILVPLIDIHGQPTEQPPLREIACLRSILS